MGAFIRSTRVVAKENVHVDVSFALQEAIIRKFYEVQSLRANVFEST